MLSRRFLRVKVFHAIYAYFLSGEKNSRKAESELFLSLERMYDLYLYFLILGRDLIHQSELKMEDAKTKRLPTDEDLNPNKRFVDNKMLELLDGNRNINEQLKDRKISWDADQEMVGKLLTHIRDHKIYQDYMELESTSFKQDQEFVVALYKKIIPNYDFLIQELQEKSIFWGYDDIDFVLGMVIKTIKKFNDKSNADTKVLGLFTDYEDDTKFVKDLFRTTIEEDKENSKMIANKTKNWDVDRIAMVDVLLMKMALTEFKNFKSVPVKVSLNEYIELSKWYSTEKSKVFINGVLDKLVAELKDKGLLKKMGRGLLEN